jgi:hypothetical protein
VNISVALGSSAGVGVGSAVGSGESVTLVPTYTMFSEVKEASIDPFSCAVSKPAAACSGVGAFGEFGASST